MHHVGTADTLRTPTPRARGVGAASVTVTALKAGLDTNTQTFLTIFYMGFSTET